MKKPKILITGTYSSYNRGDAAMLIAAAQQFRSMYPGCQITASVPFLQRDSKFYPELKTIKSSRRNLIFGTLQVFRAWAYDKTKLNFLVNNTELKAFLEADFVADVSGDGLSEDYGPHVAYSHLLPIKTALALKKPIFILPQSIGPFSTTLSFARRNLNRVDNIAAREELSAKYLKSAGIDQNKISKSADLAFLLKPTNQRDSALILKKEKITFSNKLVLGVTVSNLVEKRFNKNAASDSDFATAMANMLDKFIDKKDAQIIFIGHVTGPQKDKDDRLVAARIKDKMKNKKSAHILKGDYRPEELKGIIAGCDIFLGSRMHSNIAALSSAVPTTAISYSIKTDGIMSLLGMSKYVHQIDKLDTDKLYKSLVDVQDNSSQISNKLKSGVEKLRDMAKDSFKIIDKKLS